MRVLITGAAGFIGFHTAARLLDRGDEVIGLSVLDHVAARGSPSEVTDTLHRMEPSTVRREVEAAGFIFEGESAILANPADSRAVGVFDPSIRGRTDQFILKFRRPR